MRTSTFERVLLTMICAIFLVSVAPPNLHASAASVLPVCNTASLVPNYIVDFEDGTFSSTNLDAERRKIVREELESHLGTAARADADAVQIRFVVADDPTRFSDEGFAIVPSAGKIVLSANGSLGHLRAAHALLKQLGFRWLSPGDTICPASVNFQSVEEITLPSPRFGLRGVWTFGPPLDASYLKFLARNHLNLAGAPTTPEPLFETLGINRWGGGHNVFSLLAASDKKSGESTLRQLHPDWYGPLRGTSEPLPTGSNTYVNPCFNNSSFVDYFASQIYQELKNGLYSQVDVLNIWPSDQVKLSLPKTCNAGAVEDLAVFATFLGKLVQQLDQKLVASPLGRKITIAGIGYNDTALLPANSLPQSTPRVGFIQLNYPINRSFRSAVTSEPATNPNAALARSFTATRLGNKQSAFGVVEYFNESVHLGLFDIAAVNLEATLAEHEGPGSLFGFMHPLSSEGGMQSIMLPALAERLYLGTPLEEGMKQNFSAFTTKVEEAFEAISIFGKAGANRAEVLGSGSSTLLMLRVDKIWPGLAKKLPEMRAAANAIIAGRAVDLPPLRLGLAAPRRFEGHGVTQSIELFEECGRRFQSLSIEAKDTPSAQRFRKLATDCNHGAYLYTQIELLANLRNAETASPAQWQTAFDAYAAHYKQSENLPWPTVYSGFSQKDLFRKLMDPAQFPRP